MHICVGALFFSAGRTFLYDEPIFMVSEVDGLRIFSNSRCEFLEKVPECSEKIFDIGSVEAPALLVDAFQEYKVSPR